MDNSLSQLCIAVLCVREEIQREKKLLNACAEIKVEELRPLTNDLTKAVGNSALLTENFASSAQGKKNTGDAYVVPLLVRIEQSPNPESRVTLSNEVDAFGSRRAHLHWAINDEDRHSYGRVLAIFAEDFARGGLGRLQIVLPEIIQGGPAHGGNHHIGTTRMHDGEKEGVVDRHCQVHGTKNLFVAGSSVFPCSGFANPTYTIVALAVRLADHLKSLLG